MRNLRMSHDSEGLSPKSTATTDVNKIQSGPDSTSEPVRQDRDEVSAFIERKIAHLRESHLSQWIRAAGSGIILIGALTFLNNMVAIITTNYDVYFVAGLWSTFLVSAGAAEAYRQGLPVSPAFDTLALVLTIVATGVFVFLGVLTIKRQVWSSIVALVLYAIDTVVLLPFHPKSAIVHVILMYVIYKGIKATKRYSALAIESGTA
ncbi:MAG TPA: hypothetical protein ENI46_02305 [Firmicutes bacterium]|nr:hypothetical protein [Bacillota bacterium]